MEAAMKVSTSVWVAALASWAFAGVAHAQEGAGIVEAPAVAVPVAAVAPAPVVVPTQEVPVETAAAEAPAAAVVTPAVTVPVVASARQLLTSGGLVSPTELSRTSRAAGCG